MEIAIFYTMELVWTNIKNDRIYRVRLSDIENLEKIINLLGGL